MTRHGVQRLNQDPGAKALGMAQKPKTTKRPGRPKAQKATVQDAEPDENELSVAHLSERKRSILKKETDQMLKDLDRAAEKLASLENNEAFEEWLEIYGEDDEEILNKIEDRCGTAAKMLRARRSRAGNTTTPEILESFKDYFVYRSSPKNFTILAPVDVFSITKDVKKKTIGFIRAMGEDWPLMYSISGVESCIKHPKVLDNDEWSRLSFEFGKNHGFQSQCSGWERSQKRNKEKGTDAASHVERKLMLWYSAMMLEKHTRKNETPDILLLKLHKLHRIFPRDIDSTQVTAEILLNRKPCKNCRVFRDMLEDITGLKFIFTFIPTLGKCALRRNHHGHAGIAMGSDETLESLSEDETDDGRASVNGSSRVRASRQEAAVAQVLVLSKPRAYLADQAAPIHHRGVSTLAENAEGSDTERENYREPTAALLSRPKNKRPKLMQGTITTVARASKKIQKQQIWSYEYPTPPHHGKSKETIVIDSSSDEDETYVPEQKPKKYSRRFVSTPAYNDLQGFDAIPFNIEAVREAQRLKKRRRLEEESSGLAKHHKNKQGR